MGARVFTTRIHQGVPTMPENKSAVPRADSGSPGRPRPGHPQAAAGIVLPVPAVTAQTGRQGPVRRDLLSLDRGRGSRPARSMTWSRPWATSPVPPDPPSQGSARTSARESRSFCPGHWTTPGSPYLFVDATYLDVRLGHRVVCQALVVATGVSAQGRREILGMALGDAETTDLLDALPAVPAPAGS